MINRRYFNIFTRLKNIKVVALTAFIGVALLAGCVFYNKTHKQETTLTGAPDATVVSPQILKSDSTDNPQVFSIFKIETKDIWSKPLSLVAGVADIVKVVYTNDSNKSGELRIPGLSLSRNIDKKSTWSIEFSEQSTWSYDIYFWWTKPEDKIWFLQVVLKK